MALGLDRDDAIIRRRLRQKLEFLAEDTVDASPPTEAELRAWLDSHAESYGIEPEVAFRHVYLSPDRRRGTIDADARALLLQLSSVGPAATTGELGDPLMVPSEIPRSTKTDVARMFGDAFAEAVITAGVGQWTGPVRSGYGLHLVLVRERTEGRLPALADVRVQVERDLLAERRRTRLAAMYDEYLERYRVVVERRPQGAAPAPAAPAEGQK
jgi:hypothetical protein